MQDDAPRYGAGLVEYLRFLYWDKQLPAEDVCRLGDVSYKTMQRLFRENGIPLRSIREAKALGLIQWFGSLENLVNQVDNLIAQGRSQRDACASIGVWPATYRAAREEGKRNNMQNSLR